MRLAEGLVLGDGRAVGEALALGEAPGPPLPGCNSTTTIEYAGTVPADAEPIEVAFFRYEVTVGTADDGVNPV